MVHQTNGTFEVVLYYIHSFLLRTVYIYIYTFFMTGQSGFRTHKTNASQFTYLLQIAEDFTVFGLQRSLPGGFLNS